jgi:ribosomal protein L37AE/L43A
MSAKISLEPFKPSKPTEHWCAKCDCKIVNSEDGKSGSFFTVFGHVFSKESRQYDGEYVAVMFALCNGCNKESENKKDSIWVCTECGTFTEWTWDNVQDSGGPICPECDEDMELDRDLTCVEH